MKGIIAIVLVSIAFNLFICGTNGIIFKCHFSGSQVDGFNAYCYDCYGENIKKLEFLEGHVSTQIVFENITTLTLMVPTSPPTSTRNLTFFPTGIYKLVPNVKRLGIYGPILTITTAHLDGLTKLEQFDAQVNVRNLPGNLFRATSNLKHVSVVTPFTANMDRVGDVWGRAATGLESVGKNMLQNQKNLEVAQFHGKCVSDRAFGRIAVLNMNQVLHLACP